MGTSLIDFYRNKVKRQWKVAFASTFIIGLLVHLYKFTNTLLNHDSVYNFYSNQNMVGSGRWFLSIACGVSSYFDLPWVNGILSIILIAVTVVVIVELFRVENPVVVLIISGLTVSFPGITETFYFEFTADGYMLAMLLAALAAYCSKFEYSSLKWSALSALLICLSCGIYQAYVSFSLLLTLCYFVNELLENRHTNSAYFYFIRKQICIYAIGMISYYIIWKVCMAVQGVTANDYQGISDVSNLSGITISVSWLIHGFANCIKTIILFFLEWNIFEHGITLYACLNILFIIAFLGGFLVAAYKSGLFRRKIHLLLCLLSLLLCIPSAGIWHFASEAVGYRPMMLQSLVILYIFCAILFDRWCKTSVSDIVGLLLAIIIFNNSVVANIGYYYLDKCYEQSYATGLEIVMRIHEMESNNNFEQIAVIGSRGKNVSVQISSEEAHRIHMMSQLLETDLLFDSKHAQLYLEGMFDVGYSFLSTGERKSLVLQDEIIEMETWPSSDSMQVIDGILVIKIGEITETEEK